MSSSNSFTSKLFARRWWWVAAVLAVVLIGAAVSMLGSSDSKIEIAERALYTVEEAPLTISVTSSGNVRSSNAKVIDNKVEGRTTILWIIPEGTHVEKGDKLMELDSSELEDELVNQELDVETSTANLVTAEENLELAKKQGESDIDAAKVNFRLALLDLEKYTGDSIWEMLGWEDQAYDGVALTNLASRLANVNWGQVDLADDLQRFDLRLMPVESPKEIPSEARSVVIVAKVDDRLHFRIFDSEGNRLVDQTEAASGNRSGDLVEGLKKELDPLWGSTELAQTEMANIMDRVKSIVGPLQNQGQFAQELQQAQNNIDKINMQLAQAEDQYLGSRNLFDRGYITETEYESDQLSYQTTKLDLQLAKTERNLLEKFTKRRKIEELMSGVDQQAFLLEKAVFQAAANVRDAKAKLNAQRENHNREVRRLEETQEQLEACTIFAPQAGMVVYGTTGQDRWDDDPPLDEGVEVRERQELFRLPASDEMTADIKIHESMLEKVKEGLPVKITTDAIPNREFEGEIRKVALMPDSQSRWLNPDLKVYNTEVAITSGTRALRPGMSCQAEIIVKEFDSTKFVPIQAVLRVEGQPTVYVVGPDGRRQKRVVQVGLDNNRMIRIVSGLQTGEQVLLDPPMDEGAKRIGREAEESKKKPGSEEQEGSEGQERQRPERPRPGQGGDQDGMTERGGSESEAQAQRDRGQNADQQGRGASS